MLHRPGDFLKILAHLLRENLCSWFVLFFYFVHGLFSFLKVNVLRLTFSVVSLTISTSSQYQLTVIEQPVFLLDFFGLCGILMIGDVVVIGVRNIIHKKLIPPYHHSTTVTWRSQGKSGLTPEIFVVYCCPI